MTEITDETLSLHVGKCLLTWAEVEFQLLKIFNISSGLELERMIAIWEPIKSFDARLSILRSTLKVHLESSEDDWSDWLLIDAAVSRGYKTRNKIAHSTRRTSNGERLLQPFLVKFDSTRAMRLQDLVSIQIDSLDLHHTLTWFYAELNAIRSHKAKPSLSGTPTPGLLLRLRAEELRKREAQRQRHQDDVLVARLRKAGQWPPAES